LRNEDDEKIVRIIIKRFLASATFHDQKKIPSSSDAFFPFLIA